MSNRLNTKQYAVSEQEKKAIGARFKHFRKDILGLKNTEVAEECKVARKTISFIENGHSLPSQTVVAYLSKKYKLNQDWLILAKGEPVTKAKENPNQKDNIQARLTLLEKQVSGLQEMFKDMKEMLEKL